MTTLVSDPYLPCSATPLKFYGQALDDVTTISGEKSGRIWLKMNRREQPVAYRQLLATELFEILDADGDGQLDLSEWSSLLGTISAEDKQKFMDLFYSLDESGDKNGKISLTEWLSALQRPRIASLSDAVFEYQNLSMQVAT